MASATLTVKVKWGKETLDNVEVTAHEGLDLFKAQLFALTAVPIERQKILAKGKQLKEDADLGKLKNGDILMLMGTAEAVADGPAKPVVFEEDLTDAQKSKLAIVYPCGLTNLGNTCYMNSGLQCMRSFPELHAALKAYGRSAAASGSGSHDQAHTLTMGMRTLFDEMERSSSEKPVTPLMVLSQVRAAFPQFAERGRNGGFAQQDADEFYSQVMFQLLTKVKDVSVPLTGVPDNRLIKAQELFEGQFEQTTTCLESDSISAERSVDNFTVLKCHIDKEKSLLHECLRESMIAEKEKRAPELGRNARFVTKSAISRLPHYLTINFVRFFWKQRDGGAGVKTKILKKITFPLQLDMYEFCTEDLKRVLKVHRDAKIKADEKALGLRSAVAASATGSGAATATSMDVISTTSEEKSDESSVKSVNPSGRYELVALVTHQGRDADGGHYVGWARSTKNPAMWHKFDDDVVTEVDEAAILALQGGGDWPMGYICFYRHVLE